jgi:cytochrome P450
MIVNSFISTEDQLLSILVDLFGAGAETTATTIRWTVLYLMHNVDIQNKMWKEIDNVVGVGRLPSLSDRPNLPYCEAVILESLRLGNIVPLSLTHLVTGDVKCKGYKIPKGSVIFPCLDSVIHNEKLFPNSHDFKPERFIDTDGKVYNQDKALTFSLGKFICINIMISILLTVILTLSLDWA